MRIKFFRFQVPCYALDSTFASQVFAIGTELLPRTQLITRSIFKKKCVYIYLLPQKKTYFTLSLDKPFELQGEGTSAKFVFLVILLFLLTVNMLKATPKPWETIIHTPHLKVKVPEFSEAGGPFTLKCTNLQFLQVTRPAKAVTVWLYFLNLRANMQDWPLTRL